MNLGQTSINAFLVLGLTGTGLALALCVVVAMIFRRRRLLMMFFLLGPVFAWLAVSLFHESLFVRWHQAQNRLVPTEYPCLLYQPTFNALWAEYSMTTEEFDAWVQSHPWSLKTLDEPLPFDQEKMGETLPEKMVATEPAPNGKQLRAYHADGKTFIFYNAF